MSSTTYEDFRSNADAAVVAFDRAEAAHMATVAAVANAIEAHAAAEKAHAAAVAKFASAAQEHDAARRDEADAIVRGAKFDGLTAKVNATAVTMASMERVRDVFADVCRRAEGDMQAARIIEGKARRTMNRARYVMARWASYVAADNCRAAVLKAELPYRAAEAKLESAREALLQDEPHYIDDRRWPLAAELLRVAPVLPPPKPALTEYVSAFTAVGFADKEGVIPESANFPHAVIPGGVKVRVPKSMLLANSNIFVAADEWERQHAAPTPPRSSINEQEWFGEQRERMRQEREAYRRAVQEQ